MASPLGMGELVAVRRSGEAARVSDVPAFSSAARRHALAQLGRASRHLEDPGSARLLAVGAGTLDVLDAARQLGWSATGVAWTPDERLGLAARCHHAVDIDDVAGAASTVDLVAWRYAAQDELRLDAQFGILKLMSPQCFLAVETPRDGGHRTMPRSIEGLLSDAGLEVVDRWAVGGRRGCITSIAVR